MARACMLAALALVCAAQSACAANLNIPSWAYGMLPRGSGQARRIACARDARR